MNTLFVRLQRIVIRRFKNVGHGEIVFSAHSEPLDNADILGLYGQNGSGKTALIEALSILRLLLCGQSVPAACVGYIMLPSDSAELEFEFFLHDDFGSVGRAVYNVDLAKAPLADGSNRSGKAGGGERIAVKNERLSLSTDFEGRRRKMQTLINAGSDDEPFTPRAKLTELAGPGRGVSGELVVCKKLAYERSQSFIFSPDTMRLFRAGCRVPDYLTALESLLNFGNHCLYVIDTKNMGLINLNAELPLLFRFEEESHLSLDNVAIKLDGASVIPRSAYELAKRSIDNMNVVLTKIVPGLTVSIADLGALLMPDGSPGCTVELMSERGSNRLPLRLESEGIKKIVSILQLLIAMYNSEAITVAIDELDAGVFEYLLGELLKVIASSGKGQLIFTSHNLRPLETIDKKFIYFTTTNPDNRYIRISALQSSGNLRDVYYRGIVLEGEKEPLYEQTNNYEIALAFKNAGDFDGE